MDVLALIIGIGIICFLLLYLAFNLDKSHTLLKILLFFLFLSALNLIPKAVIDNYDNCELVLNYTNATNESGYNITTYSYGEVCVTNTKDTGNILLRLSLFIWYICIAYMVLYLIFEALKFANIVVPKEQGQKGLIKYKIKK